MVSSVIMLPSLILIPSVMLYYRGGGAVNCLIAYIAEPISWNPAHLSYSSRKLPSLIDL